MEAVWWSRVPSPLLKKQLIIGGNLNAERYWDEILQPNKNPISPQSGAQLCPPKWQCSLRQSVVYQRLPSEFDRGEDGLICQQFWTLYPIEHLLDQLRRAVCARVTYTTTLADLRQMLVEERDAMPQQCPVANMRRRCLASVAVYGSSICYWGSCLSNEPGPYRDFIGSTTTKMKQQFVPWAWRRFHGPSRQLEELNRAVRGPSPISRMGFGSLI